jgi:hypothetical protein
MEGTISQHKFPRRIIREDFHFYEGASSIRDNKQTPGTVHIYQRLI